MVCLLKREEIESVIECSVRAVKVGGAIDRERGARCETEVRSMVLGDGSLAIEVECGGRGAMAPVDIQISEMWSILQVAG